MKKIWKVLALSALTLAGCKLTSLSKKFEARADHKAVKIMADTVIYPPKIIDQKVVEDRENPIYFTRTNRGFFPSRLATIGHLHPYCVVELGFFENNDTIRAPHINPTGLTVRHAAMIMNNNKGVPIFSQSTTATFDSTGQLKSMTDIQKSVYLQPDAKFILTTASSHPTQIPEIGQIDGAKITTDTLLSVSALKARMR